MPLILLLDNIRSTYNVGAILRTADGAGVSAVYMCGLTPYPAIPNDPRPAHVASSNTTAIAKTALGAEQSVPMRHFDTTLEAIVHAKSEGYTIAALEQAPSSVSLLHYLPTTPLALILGPEVEGIDSATLKASDIILEIPMYGGKESLNVSVAAGIAAYQLLRQ